MGTDIWKTVKVNSCLRFSNRENQRQSREIKSYSYNNQNASQHHFYELATDRLPQGLPVSRFGGIFDIFKNRAS